MAAVAETSPIAGGEVVEEFETAEIEEIGESEKPVVEPVVEPVVGEEPGNNPAAGDAGKQSRAQKKVMKAMAKLNLKKVPGIMKVVLRNGKKGMGTFSIPGGEVYKVPGSDTYIVFGEAQTDDFVSRAQMKAAEKFKIPDQSAPAPLAKIEDEDEDELDVDDSNIDTEGVEDKDIELVMQQAGVAKAKAVKALKSNGNDIVNAIMELTM